MASTVTPLTSRELISMLALPLLPSLEWFSSDRGGIGGGSGGSVARSPSQGGREDQRRFDRVKRSAITLRYRTFLYFDLEFRQS